MISYKSLLSPFLFSHFTPPNLFYFLLFLSILSKKNENNKNCLNFIENVFLGKSENTWKN